MRMPCAFSLVWFEIGAKSVWRAARCLCSTSFFSFVSRHRGARKKHFDTAIDVLLHPCPSIRQDDNSLSDGNYCFPKFHGLGAHLGDDPRRENPRPFFLKDSAACVFQRDQRANSEYQDIPRLLNAVPALIGGEADRPGGETAALYRRKGGVPWRAPSQFGCFLGLTQVRRDGCATPMISSSQRRRGIRTFFASITAVRQRGTSGRFSPPLTRTP